VQTWGIERDDGVFELREIEIFDVSEILDGIRIIKSGGNVLKIKVRGGRTFLVPQDSIKV
jgi:hypothetical protein